MTPHIRLTLKSLIPGYLTVRPSRDQIAAAQADEALKEFAESQDTEDN